MKKKTLVFSVGLLLVFSFTAVNVIAEKKTQKEKGKAAEDASEKEFPWDKGPAEIDVSSYPKEQQENYKTFSVKCSKCHTLARAINSPYALPEEWEPYVKKMSKKKRSGLSNPAVVKKITEFLKYDSSVRKKDLIEKKLSEKKAKSPSEEEKKEEAEKKNGQ
ncbi:MAG: hypothetical protein HYT79_02770 [Elusimicrobia bacterium]|nr:hypothetical protein [Elusimicrobiota bacterium]